MSNTALNENRDYMPGESTFGISLTIEIADKGIDAMSISPSGRDVVLASRKGLLVVDLDNPYELPRSLLYRTAWNIADVQWNVHSHKTHWVASTANQTLLVWNLDMPSSQAVEHVLKGHTRAITDINWSAHHPEILASCAVDAFVHCWDLRDPRKPINTFSDWKAGATQVKWNRQNEHIIASSHGRFLRIWDDRRGAIPLQSIEVAQHSTKIYGVDFNRTRESGVITCALDQSVKFWDYETNITEPEQIIRTTAPVWRARHTPMGWGVVTLPQRGDNTLYLWDRRAKGLNTRPPVHEFRGHTDQVKEFLWRAKGGQDPLRDDRAFQLITWSKDQTLRLWPVVPEVLEAIGHDATKPIRFRQTRQGAEYRSYRPEPNIVAKRVSSLGQAAEDRPLQKKYKQQGVTMTKRGTATMGYSSVAWMRGIRLNRKPETIDLHEWEHEVLHLGEEFPAIEAKFPKVKFEEASVTQRACTITLQGPWGVDEEVTFLRLKIRFPEGYPAVTVPTFALEQTHAVNDNMRKYILDGLANISQRYLTRSKPCLEALVRFLLGEHVLGEKFEDEESSSSSDEDEEFSSLFPVDPVDQQVANVPVPRSCAGTWCGTKLVCFFSGASAPGALPALLEEGSISGLSLPDASSGHASSQRLFSSFGHLRQSNARRSSSDADSEEFDLEGASSTYKHERRSALSGLQHTASKHGSAWSAIRGKPTSIASGLSDHVSSRRDLIVMHDFSDLTGMSYTLAKQWKLARTSSDCLYNAQLAEDHDMLDEAEIWEVAATLLDGCEEQHAAMQDGGLTLHQLLSDGLLGRANLIGDLLTHLGKQANTQMLALLSCTFAASRPAASRPSTVIVQPLRSNTHRPSLPRVESQDYVDRNIDRKSNAQRLAPHGSWKEGDKQGTSQTSPSGTYQESAIDRRDSHTSVSSGHGLGAWLTTRRRDSGKTSAPQTLASAAPISQLQRHTTHSTVQSSPRSFETERDALAGRMSGSLRSQMEKGADAPAWSTDQPIFTEQHPRISVVQIIAPVTQTPANTLLEQISSRARSAYADTLFRLGLNVQRSVILKADHQAVLDLAATSPTWLRPRVPKLTHATSSNSTIDANFSHDAAFSTSGAQAAGIEVASRCANCFHSARKQCDPQCTGSRIRVKCTVCKVPIAGRIEACLVCEHGGHAACMRAWHKASATEGALGGVCPAGCGCACASEAAVAISLNDDRGKRVSTRMTAVWKQGSGQRVKGI